MKHLILPVILALPFLASCVSDDAINATRPGEVSAFQLTGRQWKLVELNGRAVSNLPRDAVLTLTTDGGRISGNGGCNAFFGHYELMPEQRIRFTSIGSTKMACASGMDTEQAFFAVMSRADGYVLTGTDLSLMEGRSTTLARFEAID